LTLTQFCTKPVIPQDHFSMGKSRQKRRTTLLNMDINQLNTTLTDADSNGDFDITKEDLEGIEYNGFDPFAFANHLFTQCTQAQLNPIAVIKDVITWALKRGINLDKLQNVVNLNAGIVQRLTEYKNKLAIKRNKASAAADPKTITIGRILASFPAVALRIKMKYKIKTPYLPLSLGDLDTSYSCLPDLSDNRKKRVRLIYLACAAATSIPSQKALQMKRAVKFADISMNSKVRLYAYKKQEAASLLNELDNYDMNAMLDYIKQSYSSDTGDILDPTAFGLNEDALDFVIEAEALKKKKKKKASA